MNKLVMELKKNQWCKRTMVYFSITLCVCHGLIEGLRLSQSLRGQRLALKQASAQHVPHRWWRQRRADCGMNTCNEMLCPGSDVTDLFAFHWSEQATWPVLTSWGRGRKGEQMKCLTPQFFRKDRSERAPVFRSWTPTDVPGTLGELNSLNRQNFKGTKEVLSEAAWEGKHHLDQSLGTCTLRDGCGVILSLALAEWVCLHSLSDSCFSLWMWRGF